MVAVSPSKSQPSLFLIVSCEKDIPVSFAVQFCWLNVARQSWASAVMGASRAAARKPVNRMLRRRTGANRLPRSIGEADFS